MKIVPEISLRHDLQYFLFISTPTIDIEPNKKPQWKSLCVWALHSLVCIPTWRRMHKHLSCLTASYVGGGHDRPARAATAKRKVFLKNVTTLSHNLCGAVMTAPYRQRVISFPFPEKSNHTSFFNEPNFCVTDAIYPHHFTPIQVKPFVIK